MTNQIFKPYLLRALYECSAEYGLTPHIVVKVDEQTVVPTHYIKQGEIVLNISMTATHGLSLGNEWVAFSARFQGVTHDIQIPVARISRFFVPETEFGTELVVTATPHNLVPPQPPPPMGSAPKPKTSPKTTKTNKPSHLTVVK